MPKDLPKGPEATLKALRSFLQSSGIDGKSIDPSLVAIKDAVLTKEGDWTADKIKAAFAEFSKVVNPVRLNSDGTPSDPLGPESEFINYLVKFNKGDRGTLQNVLYTQFDLLCKSSVVSDAVKKIFFQLHYPPTGKDLLCLGGTGSRSIDVLTQLASSVDEYGKLITSAYLSTFSKYVGIADKYALFNTGNQVHIPRYLDYFLNLRDEVELLKIDNNWSTTKALATTHAAAIYQDFERDFIDLLYSSIKPDELKATMVQEVVSIKEEIRELLKECTNGIEGIESCEGFKDFLNGRIEKDIFEGNDFRSPLSESVIKFIEKLNEIAKRHNLEEVSFTIGELFGGDSVGGFYNLQFDRLADKVAEARSKYIRSAVVGMGFNKDVSPSSGNLSVDIYSNKIVADIDTLIKSDDESSMAHGVMILYLLSNQAPGAPIHHFINILDRNPDIVTRLNRIVEGRLLPEHYLEKISDQGDPHKKNGILERYDSCRLLLTAPIDGADDEEKDSYNLGLLVSGSTESCIEIMVRLFEEKKLNDAFSSALRGGTRVFETLHDYEKKACHLVIRGDAESIITALVAQISSKPELFDASEKYIHDILCSACRCGKSDIANQLVEIPGININVLSDDGVTPLFIAAQNGHLNVVKALLDRGAGIDNTTNKDSTPLHVAAQNGHLNVVNSLLDRGAGIDNANKNGYTPLHVAAQNGHLNVVNSLLERGAGIDNATNKDSTPLFIAAQNGRLDVVNSLLDRGAGIDNANKNGYTPLHIAAQKGNLNIVKTLIERGAGIDNASKNGVTPLFIAAHQGNNEALKILLKNGANIYKVKSGYRVCVNLFSVRRLDPLGVAFKKGHKDIVKTLLENGATTRFLTSGVGKKDCKKFLDKIKKCHSQLKRIVSGLGKYSCCLSRGLLEVTLEDFLNEIDVDIKEAVLNMQDSGGNILAHAVRNNKAEEYKVLRDSGARENISLINTNIAQSVVYKRSIQDYIAKKAKDPELFKQQISQDNNREIDILPRAQPIASPGPIQHEQLPGIRGRENGGRGGRGRIMGGNARVLPV